MLSVELTMADVTAELMYELLKKIHERMDRVDSALGEVRHEIVAVRLQGLSTQTDINNIYSVTGRIDQRLERIEKRPELRELAERPHAPYNPA
jgi:archaellum component FlaC